MDTENTSNAVGADIGPLSQDLPFMVRNLQTLLRPEGQAIRAALDLEAGMIGVLSVVWLNPGISQNDLAASVALKKSAVTAVVKTLEARGLLRRQKHRTDKRANALSLTPDGEALVARIQAMTETMNERLLTGVSPQDRAVFFQVIAQVMANLSKPDDDT